MWLILKTNIHLITINNHLSITHSRSLARVWIFKSVHGRMIISLVRWSSLWSLKYENLENSKKRVSAEWKCFMVCSPTWFQCQKSWDFEYLSYHSVSTQVFAWKSAPIWLVRKIRAYLGYHWPWFFCWKHGFYNRNKIWKIKNLKISVILEADVN